MAQLSPAATSQIAHVSADRPADQLPEQPAVQPAEQATRSAEHPAEQPAEQTAGQRAERAEEDWVDRRYRDDEAREAWLRQTLASHERS